MDQRIVGHAVVVVDYPVKDVPSYRVYQFGEREEAVAAAQRSREAGVDAHAAPIRGAFYLHEEGARSYEADSVRARVRSELAAAIGYAARAREYVASTDADLWATVTEIEKGIASLTAARDRLTSVSRDALARALDAPFSK